MDISCDVTDIEFDSSIIDQRRILRVACQSLRILIDYRLLTISNYHRMQVSTFVPIPLTTKTIIAGKCYADLIRQQVVSQDEPMQDENCAPTGLAYSLPVFEPKG